MQKIDPHKRQEHYEVWKETRLNDISFTNEKLLKEFILDLERGRNTGGVKGLRSAGRLLANASQVKRIMKGADKLFNLKDITKINEEQLHEIFHAIQTGKITKDNGNPYEQTADLIKRFKTFYHWWIKKNKKEGKAVLDITEDLNSEYKKNTKFVYFTDADLEKMMKVATYDTRTFMLFLFDTGIRSPTEAFNIRVSDFQDNYTLLDIRDEISKTFGRKIRLMMCSDAIRKYIKDNNLKNDDLVFQFQPATINKQLKKIGKEVLGDKRTLGKLKGSELTMYDFRHSSCCYWLPRYKSRNAILYRFGWIKEKELHYYTNLLGMTDTISEEDMLLNTTKTDIEKKLIETEQRLGAMEEAFELTMKAVREMVKQTFGEKGLKQLEQNFDEKYQTPPKP